MNRVNQLNQIRMLVQLSNTIKFTSFIKLNRIDIFLIKIDLA